MQIPNFNLQSKYNRLAHNSSDPEQSQREKVALHLEDQESARTTASNPISWIFSQVYALLKTIYITLSSLRSSRIEGNVTPWIGSTLFFALLVLVVSFGGGKRGAACGTEMERTDRILGIPKVPIVSVPFTGTPTFDTDGHINIAPGSPPYIGNPSPEIDEAWEALEGGSYFAITEEEAKELWGEEYMEFEDETLGGFTAGLDVFHGLHCINQIRMALHPESYPPSTYPDGPANLAACLTHLRQLIQCSGDTTPNPTKYYEGIGQNYVDVDQVHTCRDWEAIRKWGWERFNGSLMVEREGFGEIDKVEEVEGGADGEEGIED